jgi:hypothetical protein
LGGDKRRLSMGGDRDLTFLDRVKIQAEVLVPLIKAFEAELGSERAHSIARKALQDWVRKRYSSVREKMPGNPIDLVSSGLPTFAARALEYDVVGQSSDVFDFNVTKCAYAEFYKSLGEPELGFLFVCDLDNAMAEGLGSELEFDRSQTLMEGATHCDFRYRHRR